MTDDQMITAYRWLQGRIRNSNAHIEFRVRPSDYERHKHLIDLLKSVRIETRIKRTWGKNRLNYYFHLNATKTVSEMKKIMCDAGIFGDSEVNRRKRMEYHERKRRRLFGGYSDEELREQRRQLRAKYLANYNDGNIISLKIERSLYRREAMIIDELRVRAGLEPMYNIFEAKDDLD